MAQSRDPGLQTMPAKVLWVVEGEDQVVRAKFDLPQGGECWLGWTDCGSEEYSLQQQHEVGLRTMPIRTRFEKRGRLDCSSSDIVARDNCGVFKHVPAEGLVFERVVAEGCGWDGVNLLWMGDDCPAWITGTTAGRKRWPANAIIRYIDDWPSSINDPRGAAVVCNRGEGGWFLACRTCGGRKGDCYSSKFGKSSARRGKLRKWRKCACGSADHANVNGQEVLFKYPKERGVGHRRAHCEEGGANDH